jgi:hypothetical protein
MKQVWHMVLKNRRNWKVIYKGKECGVLDRFIPYLMREYKTLTEAPIWSGSAGAGGLSAM